MYVRSYWRRSVTVDATAKSHGACPFASAVIDAPLQFDCSCAVITLVADLFVLSPSSPCGMTRPMETNPVDSKASKPPFSRRRLFRWGIGFWIVVWIVSVCGCLSFHLNIKGCNGLVVGFGCSAIFGEVSESNAARNEVSVRDHLFVSLQDLKKLLQKPSDIASMLARGGWRQRRGVTSVSFPFVGFLWLWLAAGWIAEVRLRPLANVTMNGSHTGIPSSPGRSMALTTTLIALGLAIPYLAKRREQAERQGEAMSMCCLKIRNIQQAVRGWSSIKGLVDGAPIRWEEIFGPGGVFPHITDYQKCPSGGDYQLSPVFPKTGEIAAKCTHPDHQQYFRNHDTSDW